LLLRASKVIESSDFDSDADWAIARANAWRGARTLVWLCVAAMFVLIIWAALAELDEVTRGEGKVDILRDRFKSYKVWMAA
jgi:adhesin transport system membrane fusion protein